MISYIDNKGITGRVHVAQSAERPAFNRVVAGSIPAMGALLLIFLPTAVVVVTSLGA